MNRPQPQPPYTRGTFHRRLQLLYTEKHTVSCSGFLPQNKAYATFMQPLQCDSQHHGANPHTHMATEHDNNLAASCSHSNAIRSQRFKKRIEVRTQERPPVAQHRGGTNSRMNRPQPQPPYTRGTFHCRLQLLYTEKHAVSCSGFLPQNKTHATFMQPLQCDSQHHGATLHTHMATEHDHNHSAIPMRSATRDSRNE